VSLVTVDIADYRVSADPDVILVTYALGSCIGVMLYDPVRRAAGMIHYMLPLSDTSPEKAKARPAMFADVGVPLLFRGMYSLGCEKKDLLVKVAGGGTLHDKSGRFAIGQRNYTVLRKIFWKTGVIINAEDVGGSKSRTVRLAVASGRCTVTSAGQEVEL
jgi:chemotaxis protein CheD